jgi:hypothetical protein
MIEFDDGDVTFLFSYRLARALRPRLDECLGFDGIDLTDVVVSPLEFDELLLVSWGDEIVITIRGVSRGCSA